MLRHGAFLFPLSEGRAPSRPYSRAEQTFVAFIWTRLCLCDRTRSCSLRHGVLVLKVRLTSQVWPNASCFPSVTIFPEIWPPSFLNSFILTDAGELIGFCFCASCATSQVTTFPLGSIPMTRALP